MKKQNIMPIAVLTTICLIVAALLAGVNMLTKDRIAENALKKEQASLIEVMPNATLFDEIEIPSGAPSTVKSVYRETSGLGYVLIMVAQKTSYSSGDMTISVGISNGEIVGAKLTSYNESRDLGKTTYPEKFVGKTETDYNDVEVTANVTFSSEAFKSAIGDALKTAKLLEGSSTVSVTLPSYASQASADVAEADNSLEAVMSALVPNASFTDADIPEDAPETLKELYSVSVGGYVAHIVVPGEYVAVATEAVVYIDSNGDVKNINLLTWNVGHGVEPGDFAEGFIGKDIFHMGDVELVSTATTTSLDFKKAVNSVLDSVTTLLGTREESFDELICELMNVEKAEKVTLGDDAPEHLKALYKSNETDGYAAHIIVPGQYVPVATEAVVFFSERGVVRSIRLLQWVVGHGVEPGDFAEGFVGASPKTLDNVDLVATATTTSLDFRTAVAGVADYISPDPIVAFQVLSVVIIVLSLGAFIAALIISRKRRVAK